MIIHSIVEEKYFCRYPLQALSAEEILKRYIKDCFKINGKQRSNFPKKGDYVKFKNFVRKIKSPIITDADYGRILVPENNENQKPEESSTNKYQKYVACSYGYKLVCVDH